MKKIILNLAAIIALWTGCNPKKENAPTPSGKFKEGFFILNEGNFNKGNASIDFYPTATGEMDTDIFKKVNQRPLGDVLQDFYIHEDKGFIIVNNSHKMEIVDINTFESKAVIENLSLPRCIRVANGKAYISETVDYTGSKGKISIINIENNTIIKSLTVGINPDKMLTLNNKLFLVNSGENTVSVINTTTDELEKSIEVNQRPNSLVYDGEYLWVLCGGKKVYFTDWTGINEALSTAGSLEKINPATGELVKTIPLDSKIITPNYLNYVGNKKLIYAYGEKIMAYDSNTDKTITLIEEAKNTYGLNTDPSSQRLYRADHNGFQKNSTVYCYTLDGKIVYSFSSGIGTNGFIFYNQ